MTEILYEDKNLIFCVKEAGISSETELPQALKEQTKSDIFPVHRLDTPVGGVMVYAKNKQTAALMSDKIAGNDDFEKTYLAVCEGEFDEKSGYMEDLLFKDSRKNKSFVVKKERKGVKKALLYYEILGAAEYKQKRVSLAKVTLKTGRSHQIRVQFASRRHPLAGDGKYGSKINCPISLFSHSIKTCKKAVTKNPPDLEPWNLFKIILDK
ncbi:MAG: RNA pseudouridine synthase [Clostridia bacterium]|nr:RNA pseudouridine synthase [Clostridia bacterium]